ncbi:MAG: MBL fold metallo-hydrolase [Candidatus Omnitrophica bacterium]|nr:MBL fold metallo-hydrolase [Candidatus Omnitrophota bacterium]
MQLIIHRGTKEIGGSCVELQAAKTRILIDFGMPLVDEKREPFDTSILRGKSIAQLKESNLLPDVKGLYQDEPKGIDAILISHSHQDHYGLLDYASPNIPLYMSQGVKGMIEVSNIFIHNKLGKLNAKVVKPWKSFKIGDFTIIPYLVDHSGPDALAFLVEADAKRVYYSGDFRSHGRKSIVFENMLKNPPKDIDYLLLEGSMLGREGQLYKDESSVEQRMKEILRETKNVVFLSCSSQNIDRLVSAYRACLQTGRTFVIDLYTAFILSKLRKVSKGIPQYNSDNIRIKFWKAHADSLNKAGYRDLLYVYNKRKIELLEIDEKKEKILMLVRDNSVFPRTLKELSDIKGAKLVYSMYEKYLTDEFKTKCGRKGIEIEHVHTSGHATVDNLQAFASALNPKTTIPIHTFEPEKYKELFKNIEVLKDGQVFDI